MIDSPQLYVLLFQRRFSLLVAAVIGLLIAVGYSVAAPRLYEVETVVMPAAEEASPSLGSAIANVPLLAGMFGGVQSDRSIEYIAVLNSQQFAQNFLAEAGLLEELRYATFLGRAFGIPSSEEMPTARQVKRFQKHVVSVSRDKTTALVSVRFHTRSADRAAELANQFVRQADDFLRARALDEANAALNFLETESQTAQQVELRQSINTLVLGWLQKKILATTRHDFAFRVVDPAVAPLSDDFVLPMISLLIVGVPLLLVGLVALIIVGRALWSNMVNSAVE